MSNPLQVATVGFMPHDRAVFDQQVRLLRTRTQRVWNYSQTDPASAALVIVHDGDDAQPLTGPRAGVFYAVTPPVRARGFPAQFNIDWPIRLISLLDVLGEVERRLERGGMPAPGVPVIALLRRMHPAARFNADGIDALVHATRGHVFCSGGSREALVTALLAHPDRLAGAAPDTAPAPGMRFICTLDSLRWSLALRQGPALNSLDERQCYRLAAWPRFGEWESTPEAMRLAALFSQQPATLAQAARAIGTGEEPVRAFLYACSLCDLGLSTEPAPQAAPPAPPPEPVETGGGFFARLRHRLGLDFGRARKAAS